MSFILNFLPSHYFLTAVDVFFSPFFSTVLIIVVLYSFDDLIVFFFNILFASSCQDNPSEKDANQGTLVVFNLDSSVSTEELHQIFGIYGEIREVRL